MRESIDIQNRARGTFLDAMAVARLLGAAAWFLFAAAFSGRSPMYLPALPYNGVYVLVAVALLALRRWRPTERTSSVMLPLVDVPLTTLILAISLFHADVPDRIALWFLPLSLVLVMFSLLSLSLRVMAATIATALIGQQLMLHFAGYEHETRIATPLLTFVAAAVLFYTLASIVKLVSAVAAERSRTERLGRYFSPTVAALIQADGPQERVERRVVSVLFADLRGFTAMVAESDPEEAAATLNEWLGAMVAEVFEHGGTLDKFMGDGLMAWFGAPLDQPTHPAQAVRCAQAMQRSLDRLNERRATAGKAPLRMGVGVHTGEALVGTVGPDIRREFTAIGATVNRASRIESLTKDLHERVLISDATKILLPPGFITTEMTPQQVKGITDPVATFSVDL